MSQKELEKALHEEGLPGEIAISKQMHKMKARIEVIADFDDLKKIKALIVELAGKG